MDGDARENTTRALPMRSESEPASIQPLACSSGSQSFHSWVGGSFGGEPLVGEEPVETAEKSRGGEEEEEEVRMNW